MAQKKFTRRVFYLQGFDSRGVKSYFNAMSNEAQQYQERFDEPIEFCELTQDGKHATSWEINSQRCDSVFTCLVWDDLVCADLKKPFWLNFREGMATFFYWLGKGAFSVWMKQSKLTAFMILYSFVMAFIYIAIASVIAVTAMAVVQSFVTLPALIYAVCMIGLVALLLMATKKIKKIERKFFVWYLFQIYAYIKRIGDGPSARMSKRLSWFAQYLKTELDNNDYDEVLFVGHCLGAFHMGEMLRELDGLNSNKLPKLSLLSIGQYASLFTAYPNAKEILGDVRFVIENENVSWVDVSSPQDPISCPLRNIAKDAGAQIDDKKELKPKILSARFNQIMPTKIQNSRWDWFSRHFLYMTANEVKGDYDWFAIIAGNQTLSQRFDHRQSPKRFN